MRIPPELTTLIIGVGSVLVTFLVAAMTRRGAREDARIKEDDQAFVQMTQLAETRRVEIVRLAAERDAANVEKERVREAADGRYDRQQDRCRAITEALVVTIDSLRATADAEGKRVAERVLQSLADHNERDHTVDVDDSVDRPA